MILGRDLKVGDVIKYWPTGDRGMRIERIGPYTGWYNFHAEVDLVGIGAEAHRRCKTVISKDEPFEIIAK